MRIAFYGIDGAGKTTLIKYLREYRQNDLLRIGGAQKTSVVALKNTSKAFRRAWLELMGGPTDSDYYTGIAGRLYAVAGACDFVEFMSRTDSDPSQIVLCDRGSLCHVAFGSSVNQDTGRLIELLVRSVPPPDHSFYINVDVDLAWRRVVSREDTGLKDESVEMLSRFSQAYGGLLASRPEVHHLDGSKEIAFLAKDVIECLDRKRGPVCT